MFGFSENFSICDNLGMPYSLIEERGHRYKSKSAEIKNGVFKVLRANTTFLFKTPRFKNFGIKATVGFSEPTYCVSWGFLFGYNKELKTGKMVLFNYLKEKKILKIRLFDVKVNKYIFIEEAEYRNVKLSSNEKYAVNVKCENGKCFGGLDNYGFSFKTGETYGNLGISLYFPDDEMKGVSLFYDFSITSDDQISVLNIFRRQCVIPHYDGGSENYVLTVSVDKLDEEAYRVSYDLDGGVFSREPKDYKMEIWTVQYDIFKNAYIAFSKKTHTNKMYLKNGMLVFSEQNEFGKFGEQVFKAEKMPFKGTFLLTEFDSEYDLIFGYDDFRRLGNEFQGGGREFIYDKDSKLIYSGESVFDDELIVVKSPENKKIVGLIPKDVSEYDKAIFHAQNNHYFIADECIKFEITVCTKRDISLYSVKAEITDTYFNNGKSIELKISDNENTFRRFGYFSHKYKVETESMPQGVYHICVRLYYGGKCVKEHISAFEIIDSKNNISPAEASGLPFMYSGEGAPPEIEYNCPDPCIIKPDFNICHYLSGIQYQATVAERRNPWKLLKLYKKKAFTWIDERTVPNGKSYRDYPQSLKNSDFVQVGTGKGIFLNIINPNWFDYPDIREIYNNFRKDHPQYADKIFCLEGGKKVTLEDLEVLFSVCPEEWVQYYCERKNEISLKCYGEIRKINPNIKISHYGPYAQYGSNYWSEYSAKWRGISNKYKNEIVDGFYVFEDYPFICEQQTHYSAWAMMSMILNIPDTKIMAELFYDFAPVCPDGYVFYANPPYGNCKVKPYQTVTQIYEYMYSTPVFRGGQFHYYSDNYFQILQSYNIDPEQRFTEFLKGWGCYLENKPAKPLRSAAFIAEFEPFDDRYDLDYNGSAFNNVSQAGECFVYEQMAEYGMPKGFMTNFDGLKQLDNDMADLICIPSLKDREKSEISKLRELFENGAAMVAVGYVDGLEDIFGVEKCKSRDIVNQFKGKDDEELITPRKAEFRYRVTDAETVLYAVNTVTGAKYPAIIKKDKAVLINCYICDVGSENYVFETFGLANISNLLKETCARFLKSISEPAATADGRYGINVFENTKGETMLMLTDYSYYGESSETSEAFVRFDNLNVKDISFAGHTDDECVINKFFDGERLSAFSVEIKQRQALMFKLKV